MALLKKKESADEFRVPSLSEASPEYAALLAKRDELNVRQGELRRDIREAEAKLRQVNDTPGERLSAEVAALLGDSPDAAFGMRAQISELRKRADETETAIEILERRIQAAKSPASALVVAASREEYRKRATAVLQAAAELQTARLEYLDLRWQFEAEDIQWTTLGPLTIGFLGDHTDGPLATLSKETIR